MTGEFNDRWLAYFALIEDMIEHNRDDSEFRQNLIESLAAEKHRARTNKGRAPGDLRHIELFSGRLCR
jgi:hypothetical protein